MKQQQVIALGGFLAMLSVILGAFGAHLLKELLSPDKLESFQTGVRYQFFHGIALILVGILWQLTKISQLKVAAYLFLSGTLLFSGSIYLLSCNNILGIEHWTFLGPVTPLGGISYIVGWFFFFYPFFTKKEIFS